MKHVKHLKGFEYVQELISSKLGVKPTEIPGTCETSEEEHEESDYLEKSSEEDMDALLDRLLSSDSESNPSEDEPDDDGASTIKETEYVSEERRNPCIERYVAQKNNEWIKDDLIEYTDDETGPIDFEQSKKKGDLNTGRVFFPTLPNPFRMNVILQSVVSFFIILYVLLYVSLGTDEEDMMDVCGNVCGDPTHPTHNIF